MPKTHYEIATNERLAVVSSDAYEEAVAAAELEYERLPVGGCLSIYKVEDGRGVLVAGWRKSGGVNESGGTNWNGNEKPTDDNAAPDDNAPAENGGGYDDRKRRDM